MVSRVVRYSEELWKPRTESWGPGGQEQAQDWASAQEEAPEDEALTIGWPGHFVKAGSEGKGRAVGCVAECQNYAPTFTQRLSSVAGQHIGLGHPFVDSNTLV